MWFSIENVTSNSTCIQAEKQGGDILSRCNKAGEATAYRYISYNQSIAFLTLTFLLYPLSILNPPTHPPHTFK